VLRKRARVGGDWQSCVADAPVATTSSSGFGRVRGPEVCVPSGSGDAGRQAHSRLTAMNRPGIPGGS